MKHSGSDRGGYTDLLRSLERRGLVREERVRSEPSDPGVVMVNGRPLVNLSSNDYLGLSRHPAVVRAACEAAAAWGSGSGASRMISGSSVLHARLEAELADFTGQGSALAFGSGYLANAGILPALTSEGDVILSDRLNHASIVDGCRLSRARVRIYEHGDAAAVRTMLEEERGTAGRKIIVTESTFSMDGDEAPLGELADIAGEHGALLVVDEAHSLGVKGEDGRGLSTALAGEKKPHVIVGTFGKALGAYGAFAASSLQIRTVLVSRCRTMIYSTALPPAVMAAARTALHIVRSDEGRELRQRLWNNCGLMREALAAAGLEQPATQGPIFLLPARDTGHALDLEKRFMDEGVFVRAIRYPTVPEGSERLRLTVHAALDPEVINRVRGAIERVMG
jgi:glycine C-acetyltransferase